MSNKLRGQKFCVYVLWLFKKGNQFAPSRSWRVRKPIDNVKVNVRTVKAWKSKKLKNYFHFLLTNNCHHSPPRKVSTQVKVQVLSRVLYRFGILTSNLRVPQCRLNQNLARRCAQRNSCPWDWTFQQFRPYRLGTALFCYPWPTYSGD